MQNRNSMTMNTMKTILVALVAIFPLLGHAREDDLARLLEQCLEREAIAPDSIEYNLQLLEEQREGQTGVSRAVYTACLAQLYAMRAHSDATGEWRQRSIALFREALADPEALYAARTKDWLPLVERGKNEKIYGSNMLYVLWRAAHDWARDSVMSEQQLIDFYAAHGNEKPQQVATEIARLNALNDSIWHHAPRLWIRMAQVYYPGDSLRLDIDTANLTRLEWKLRDARGRLLGKNVLTAPLAPGRYTLEVRGWTDVRLRKAARAAKATFVVSRLQALVMDVPAGKRRVMVVDARTGEPIPEAEVNINTDECVVKVSLDADSCLPEIHYYGHYAYHAPAASYTARTAIYTDRAVYRPGQKVQVSAVLYEQKHWQARLRTNKQCTVRLMDRKRGLLADTIVTSDDMGAISASLAIPTNVELGMLILSVDEQTHTVRVEEYRRPTFFVELDDRQWRMDNTSPQDASQSAGYSTLSIGFADLCRDSANQVNLFALAAPSVLHSPFSILHYPLSGRAIGYDGVPLRGARVTATAHRIRGLWWRRGMAKGDVSYLDTLYTDQEGRFTLQVPVDTAAHFKMLPRLCVEVAVLSSQGETQTASTSLRLFPDPPIEPEPEPWLWCQCPVDTFAVGEPARLEFRNHPGEQRYVFLTAFAGNSIVLDTMMLLADTLAVMPIPYRPHYGDGLRVIAAHALDGQVHCNNVLLKKRLPQKRLDIHWDTFRDHTRPGAVEQWSLRVADAHGRPVQAAVMMGMYDSSLDALAPNRWALGLGMTHCLPYAQMRHGHSFMQPLYQHFDVWTHRVKYPDLSHLDPKYFLSRVPQIYGMMPGMMRLRADGVHTSMRSALMAKNTDVVADAMVPELAETDEEVSEALVSEQAAFDAVEMRSDFSETALFVPHLRTDGEGRVQVAVNMPQSLTTWALNVLAYTEDLDASARMEKVVARKVLSTRVNVPRFVREGDQFFFTVAVANQGDTQQSGTMQVQVLDAETDRALLKKTVTFQVDKDRDTVYAFALPIHETTKPRNHETTSLLVKAVALTPTDSDGEQREVPVLSSVVSLTEGRAFTLLPGESVELDIADLFPQGATERRLVVEKVLDPMQMAIDALPHVVEPKNEDALSYASAYYAAQMLGRADTTVLIGKLQSMQREDGGMPWFCGFTSSTYITREVGYLLARLGSDNAVARQVLEGIKRYLLKNLEESIERRKEYDKDWTATLADLRTLYVLVKDGQATEDMLAMTRKVLKRLPKDVKMVDSESLAIALIVKHMQNETVLREAVETLAHRLHHRDGTYLAYRGGAWPSIDRRLSIHTQVMEAWRVVCPEDSATLRGMQLWLLNQKRTQGWKNPVECINAVYALTNGEWRMENGEPMEQREQTSSLDLPSRDRGRRSQWRMENGECNVQRDTIDLATTKVLTIANEPMEQREQTSLLDLPSRDRGRRSQTTKQRNNETTKQPIWASVMAEYTLPMESVESAGMDISLERTLSAERPRVGDRVKERVLVDARRDYEYLVLSIPRAAAMEPLNKRSGYGWQGGVHYYRQVREDCIDYFIPALPHGKYIIETDYTIEREGQYSTGIPTIRCCYAEEFRGHGSSEQVIVSSE